MLFLFNPFGAPTLTRVLDKVRRDATRGFRVAYAQATHDDVFERQPWLEQTERWDAPDGGSDVSFYRSR